MKKLITVVGAIIENENREILCALRSPSMTLQNLWEFPGGEVEPVENLKKAVEREIRKELGCKVEFLSVFHDSTHEYDDIIVNLITIKCKLISGTPVANEHSKLLWLKRENLHSLLWAPADMPAVIQLASENV